METTFDYRADPSRIPAGRSVSLVLLDYARPFNGSALAVQPWLPPSVDVRVEEGAFASRDEKVFRNSE
jgi:hypothetical protein